MDQQRINIMEDTPAAPKQEAAAQTQVTYGSVSERFIALLIDFGVIFLPCSFLISLYFRLFVKGAYDFNLFTGAIILVNVIFILYETIFSSGDRVTLGKALVGIAVMKQDESGPLSLWQAFRRALGYYVSTALFCFGFAWAYLDTRHRALHDLIGGSVVVQVRPNSTSEKLLLRAVGALLLGIFVWLFYSKMIGGANWYQNYQITQAENFLRKIGRLEEAHKRLYGNYTNDFLRLVLLSGDPVQFQRDMNKVLSPKGFKLGVQEQGYKIAARAKDKEKTAVYYEQIR